MNIVDEALGGDERSIVDEALGEYEQQPVQQQQKPEGKGFFTRVGEDIGKRWKNIKNINTPIHEEAYLQGVGQIAGLGSDIIGQGLKSTYQTVMPQAVQDIIAEGGRNVMEYYQKPIKGAVEAYGSFAKEYPNLSKDVEAVANIASFLPTGKGAQIVGKIIGAPMEEAVNVARDIAASRIPLKQQISNAVKTGINKGIRPTVVGKITDPQVKQYMSRAEDAVKTIVSNRDNLVLTDKVGNKIKGTLPQSLSQFSEAIDQTKRNIFRQYDDMARAAGENGAAVDLREVAKEITKVATDPTTNDLFPGLAKHAEDLSATLYNRGVYTAEQAQDAIAKLNNSLKAFYKNPSYENASRAGIDALLVNNLRKGLDDAIENAVGEGYQGLKNQYGSLKAIEKEVAHRATVDARKNVKGLIDFTDIFTAGELLSGLVTMNPSMIAKGAVQKGFKEYFKWINDPNNIVKTMFGDVEKLLNKSNAPRSKTVGSLAAMNPLDREATPPMKPPPYFRKGESLPSTDVLSGKRVGAPYGYPELPAPPLKGLPAGQGFELSQGVSDYREITVPYTSRTRLLLQQPMRDQTLALPAGQGFEVVKVTPYLSQKSTAIHLPYPMPKISEGERLKNEVMKGLRNATEKAKMK